MKTSKVLKAEYSSLLYINILIALTCLVTMFNQNVFAQSFPVRPITLVVAFPAGSSTDVMARDMAVSMANSLGQSVIVSNRAGAGGVTGTDFVAKSAPDGYTLGWGTSSQLVMNPGVYKSLPFDIDKDISQVGLVVKIPLVILAGNQVPLTLKEFVAMAKQDNSKFKYGSAGKGSVSHVMTEVFLKQAGIEMLHIPYRGAAPALTDLAGGHVDIVIDTLIATSAFVDQGKAHWLGLGGDKRSQSQPQVPTFAEQGYPDFGAYSWGSVYGPSKISSAVMTKLNQAVAVAMQTPIFKARIQQVGGEQLGPVSPQQADEIALKERSKWVPFIKNSGIVAE